MPEDVMELVADFERKTDIIRRFFEQEHWHCGGPIPDDLLYSDRNVFLLGLKLEEAIDIAHASVAKARLVRDHPELGIEGGKFDKHLGEKLFPKVLHTCEKRHIPQNFIGGILLIYLEICERVSLLIPEKDAEESC